MNQFELALQTLARLKPGFFPPKGIENEVVINAEFRDSLAEAPPAGELAAILDSLGHVPPYSALLGVCEDGLPLLMDLRNPSPGSILVLGEAGSGKTRFLRSLLSSAARLNPAEQVAFQAISSQPGELERLTRSAHCLGLFSCYERKAGEAIVELSALAEQRRSGRERGPAVILAIDDLASLAGASLDYSAFVHLKWLLSRGPGSMVWPVITLRPESVETVHPSLLGAFRTCFQSEIGAAPRRRRQLEAPRRPGRRPRQGPVFCGQIQNEWMRFAIPGA